MTLRTITFDDEQWQVVPKVPDARMSSVRPAVVTPLSTWRLMLAVAPEPPAQQPLTDKQAYAIAEEFWDEYGIPRQQTLRVIRDTERHHGIGKGESNED